MKCITLVRIAATALLIVGAAPAITHAHPVGDVSTNADDDNLQRCERECRARFGLETTMNWGRFSGYATCTQQCQEKFWKNFDGDKQTP